MSAPAPPAPRHRRWNERGISTRESLLLATERLVAIHGIAGVSTRKISQEAGTELGAIHHHFGTKDRLLLAVLEWRVDLVDELVQQHIAVRRSKSAELTIRDLAEFIVNPLLELTLNEGSIQYYPAFLKALSNYPELVEHIAVDTNWNLTLLDIFEEVCPHLDPHERSRRFALCTLMTIGALADSGTRAWLARNHSDNIEALPGTLLSCVTAILGAPVSPS